MLARLRGEADAVVLNSRWILIVGIIAIAVSYLMDGHGIISGTFAVSFGAAGRSLSQWRTERGLWMLVGVFLSMFGTIYLLFCIGQMADAWRGAQVADVTLIVDFAIGTILLSATVRFLWTVARQNYVVSLQRLDQ